MKEYSQYSREQLIQKIKFLESENNFLKEYIRGTKEFKDFNKWVDDDFGGTNNEVEKGEM